jgi:maleamate amidohydrolase
MGLKFLEKDQRIPYIADTLEQYRKAGFTWGKDLYKKGKRPALLVVDLQQTYTSPDSPLGLKGASPEIAEHINSVVEHTKMLIDAIHKKKLPIVYVTSVHREDGADGGRVGEKMPVVIEYSKRGSKWVEIDKRISPQASDYIIEKKVSSAFIGTPLLQILTYNRIDTCIIAGVSISACVRQATVDAVSNGFYAVLPEECVGDRGIGPGKASLFDIMVKFGDVTSMEDVIAWINGLA